MALPALALIGLVLAQPLWAQTADVPRPDAQGDFHSAQVSGGRGSDLQRYWLVIDRDPRGLLCRDDSGRALLALKYGSVLEADPGNAPLLGMLGDHSGRWLRVKVKPVDVQVDARLRGRGLKAVCSVRANMVYLAPINPDSLQDAFGRHH